jgi:hypothetical protein
MNPGLHPQHRPCCEFLESNSQDCPKHQVAIAIVKLYVGRLLAVSCPRYHERIACYRQRGSIRLTQSRFHGNLCSQAFGHRFRVFPRTHLQFIGRLRSGSSCAQIGQVMSTKYQGGTRDADALADRQSIGTRSIVPGFSQKLNAVDE